VSIESFPCHRDEQVSCLCMARIRTDPQHPGRWRSSQQVALARRRYKL
jgi:hypothetical protein